jgi:hypothetical protein
METFILMYQSGVVLEKVFDKAAGVYISVQKRYLSPPLLKMIFFLLSGHVVLRLPSLPFCLNSSLF